MSAELGSRQHALARLQPGGGGGEVAPGGGGGEVAPRGEGVEATARYQGTPGLPNRGVTLKCKE